MNCLNLLKLWIIFKQKNLEIILFVSIHCLFHIPLSIILGKSGFSCETFLWMLGKTVVGEKEPQRLRWDGPAQTPLHIYMHVQVHTNTYMLRGKLHQLTWLFGAFKIFLGLDICIYLKKTFSTTSTLFIQILSAHQNLLECFEVLVFLKWKLKLKFSPFFWIESILELQFCAWYLMSTNSVCSGIVFPRRLFWVQGASVIAGIQTKAVFKPQSFSCQYVF